jgi:hypothetical protein
LKLYHDGVPGPVPGQRLLPPVITGARSCVDHDGQHCRDDRVYLTTDPNLKGYRVRLRVVEEYDVAVPAE